MSRIIAFAMLLVFATQHATAAELIINGKRYEGNNIIITDNEVYIDGERVTPKSINVNIVVNGNVDRLEVDSCEECTVTGNAGTVRTMSGDAHVGGDIHGMVKTMSGDVSATAINGNVSTMSGDVFCR